MRLTALLLAILLPAAASAQTTGEQKAADYASWAVWGVATTVDVLECRHDARETRCFAMAGVRNGVVAASTYVTKKLVHSARPCAPTCGNDDNYSNIPSGHTAFTAATMPLPSEGVGPRLVVAVSATALVGFLRWKATKHDTVGIATGALIGYGASYIR